MARMNNTSDVDKVAALARAIGVSEDTVRRWEASGHYPADDVIVNEQSAHPNEDPEWESIASIGRRFEVSSKTVRRWISFGYVEARRFGPKLIRVRVQTVRDLGERVPWNDFD
jgi:predicted site-specific integrase-resolvase